MSESKRPGTWRPEEEGPGTASLLPPSRDIARAWGSGRGRSPLSPPPCVRPGPGCLLCSKPPLGAPAPLTVVTIPPGSAGAGPAGRSSPGSLRGLWSEGGWAGLPMAPSHACLVVSAQLVHSPGLVSQLRVGETLEWTRSLGPVVWSNVTGSSHCDGGGGTGREVGRGGKDR